MHKNDAFVAKIVTMRLTKISMAIFVPDERPAIYATLRSTLLFAILDNSFNHYKKKSKNKLKWETNITSGLIFQMAFQVSKHRWLCWLLCPQATGSSFCSVAAKGKEKGGKKSKMWHFGKKAVRSRDKDSARNREGGVQGHNLPKNQGLCKVPKKTQFL